MTDAQGNITGFWSMVAPDYEAHAGNVPAIDTPLYRAWVDQIEALVPPSPTDALDLATGTGFVALILAGLGHRVTAVDISADMLEQARAAAAAKGLSIRFLSDDAVTPSMDAGTFDVVTCRHLLWTLREPDRTLANWRTLLRPGGRLVAFDGFWFDAAGPRDDEPEPFRRYYTSDTRAVLPFMHIDRVDPVVAAVERAGFHRVEARSLPNLAGQSDGSVPYVVTGYS